MHYCQIIADEVFASLAETVDHQVIAGSHVTVYRDPSWQQVLALLKRYTEIRGLEHDGTFLVWSSYDAVHYQIEATYGLPRRDTAEFAIRFFDGSADVTCFTHKARLLANAWFARLLRALPHVMIESDRPADVGF